LAAALNFSRSGLLARLGIDAPDRLGSSEAITNPGAVIEHPLPSVVQTTLSTLRPENPFGSEPNLSVNFAFTLGVKRKFSQRG
jgi:hypothetical protein